LLWHCAYSALTLASNSIGERFIYKSPAAACIDARQFLCSALLDELTQINAATIRISESADIIKGAGK